MYLARHLLPLALVMALLWPTRTEALNLAPAPLEVLLDEAQLVVRGVVISAVPEFVNGREGQLRTRYQLLVWEHLRAPRDADNDPTLEFAWLEFLQPGGQLDELVTIAPGIAPLAPGDEVILLLTETPWGLQPLGYPLGTFYITPGGEVVPAWSGYDEPDLHRHFPRQSVQGWHP